MDGRDNSDLRSYFNHPHVIDGAASFSTAGKEIFSTPFSSAAVDANSFAIPCAVTARSTSARPAAAATIAAESAKRKRGRPRKYGARPSLPSLPASAMSAAARAFSPLAQRPSLSSSSRKKEATSSNSSARNAQLTALGNAGQGFTPHIITISAGEDLVNKLVSMMQKGKRAVCVLSATGSILNPSFRQPASSSTNVTYEGMFDIISLSGALIYAKADGTVSRTSGLGICLSGVDGRIVGGGVDGPLMAAGPVQVIAGSFLIDVKSDFSASTKTEDYTNKLATETAGCTGLTSPISMESILGSSRKITSSRGSDDYQSMGEGYHLFHSQPFFPSPHWDDDVIFQASPPLSERERAGTFVDLREYADLLILRYSGLAVFGV